MFPVLQVAVLIAVASPHVDVASGCLGGSVLSAGEPVAWAMISLVPYGADGEPTHAVSGADGAFLIGGIAAGEYRAFISHIGYDTPAPIALQIVADQTTVLTVALSPRVYVQPPIVVRASRPPQPGGALERVISRDRMARDGGMLADPLRAITWTGGVETRNDFDGRVSIRGASPSETGVTLDGFALPSAYHLGGLTSILHPAALEEIRFYTGGHPASLGPGSSGLVAATTRRGGTAVRLAQLSAIAAGAVWQGPVTDRLSVLATVRATYHDAVVHLFGADGNTTIPNFHDVNVSATLQTGASHALRLHWLRSGDSARMGVSSGSGNRVGIYSRLHRGALFWDGRRQRKWGEAGIELGVAVQPYEYDLRVDGDDSDAMDWRSQAAMARASLWMTRGAHRIRLGMQEVHQRIDYDVNLARGFWQAWSGPSAEAAISSDPVTLVAAGSTRAGTRSVYADYGLSIGQHWLLEPGVRVDEFEASSERFADPRVTLSWRDGSTRVHVARGVYHGHPLERVGDPTAVTGDARARRSVHTVAGASTGLGSWGGVAVEVYNRSTTSVLMETAPGVYESRGSERATGIEAQWERRRTRWRVSAGYGFARASQYNPDGLLVAGAGLSPDGRLAATLENAAPQWVASPWDPGHSLRVRADFDLSATMRLGLKWRYRTGAPVTPIEDTLTDANGTTIGIAGPPGSARLPAYHRLDIRIERTVPTRHGSWSVFMELVNAYNRANVFQRFYTDSYGAKTDYRMLPVLPALGISAEF